MDKARTDKIIGDYLQRIYGFSLSKTQNADKAEELASRITLDVYASLLKADEVHNTDGYIYRVASNVYARFVDEEVKGKYISLDEVIIPYANDFTSDLENDEAAVRLRKEISYLTKTRREITVMYYFHKMKQQKIAKKLDIPSGTVKWHLHDAKCQIKEGFKMRESVSLGMAPVKLINMGHSGNPGPENKDTRYYLQKLISQNIAYAAYHEPKTISQIAAELGIPAAFVEDEVFYLEENGFINKTAANKYLTNVRIIKSSKDSLEKNHEIYMKYAKIIADKYIPLVFDAMKDWQTKGIYTPFNDFNFLMWSIITFALGQKLYIDVPHIDISKYYIKPKTGGDFIAYASIENDFHWDELSFDNAKYGVCGDMSRCGSDGDLYSIYAWQLNTYYDDREGNWINNKYTDYYWLYEHMTGIINKNEHVEKYSRLFEKGYIIDKNEKEYVNMVVTTIKEPDFRDLLPDLTDELKETAREIDAEMQKTGFSDIPAHMHDLVKAHQQNCLANPGVRTRVLEILFNNGILIPLTAEQKHSVNTILFSDRLPK